MTGALALPTRLIVRKQGVSKWLSTRKCDIIARQLYWLFEK